MFVALKGITDEDVSGFAFDEPVEFLARGKLQVGVRHLGPVAGLHAFVHAGDHFANAGEDPLGRFAAPAKRPVVVAFVLPAAPLRSLERLVPGIGTEQDDVLPGGVVVLRLVFEPDHHDDVPRRTSS